jgi:hypothetical protein
MSLLRSSWVGLAATASLIAVGFVRVASTAPSASAGAPPGDETVAVRLEPRQDVSPLVKYYRPVRITLSEKSEVTLKGEPEYHSDKPLYGTMTLGIGDNNLNLDQERGRAEAMAKAELLEYPHVFDGLVWKNAVVVLYRVHSIPQTYLLDRDLKIVAKGLHGEALERRLQELLGEGDPAAAAAVEKAKTTASEPRDGNSP